MFLFFVDAELGAQTTLHCALEQGIEHLSGHYFSKCAPHMNIESKARDDAVAKKLWELSESFCGLSWNQAYNPSFGFNLVLWALLHLCCDLTTHWEKRKSLTASERINSLDSAGLNMARWNHRFKCDLMFVIVTSLSHTSLLQVLSLCKLILIKSLHPASFIYSTRIKYMATYTFPYILIQHVFTY